MKRRTIRKIRKVVLSMLGTVILAGGFLVACRMETEDLMSPTYETVGKVMHNEYVSRNNWIISVNVDGELYTYYADAPEKLLSKKNLKMNSKKTLSLKDDEVINVLN